MREAALSALDPANPPVRTVFVLTLIALLAACPLLCGTAGEVAGAETHGAIPGPVNDDDCLCNGALKAADGDLRTAGLDLTTWPPGSALPCGGLVAPRPALLPSASPADRAEDACPGARCARLQHYRC